MAGLLLEEGDALVAYPVAKHLFRCIFFPFLRRVTGLENLPSEGAFILAANHCSYMDSQLLGMIIANKLNRKTFFLGKKEHFKTPWERCFNQWGGMIPVNRQASASGLRVASEALSCGKTLVIYPEGTRSLDGKLQVGKTGIAKLALETEVPVIPVGIVGTFDVLPKGRIFPRLAPIEVHIGEPLKPVLRSDISLKLQRQVFTANIMSRIALLSHQKMGGKALYA